VTDDERQIRELVDAWMAASKAGDVAAVLALMTDDVIFMTPGQAPFGKKEYAANSERMRDVKMDGDADIQEIEVVGDRAYLRNHLTVTLTQQGQAPRRMSGYTLGVLRKEADGHWRLARDANLVMPENG
jgi:uncharacterized protein (TIGR02246 family)